jgi:hypothetical protein
MEMAQIPGILHHFDAKKWIGLHEQTSSTKLWTLN